VAVEFVPCSSISIFLGLLKHIALGIQAKAGLPPGMFSP
jgi:hypothetical protein